MKKILTIIISMFLILPFINAEEKNDKTNTLAPSAKSAILIEESTGEIIYEFNSHEKLEPASMTKFMTT